MMLYLDLWLLTGLAVAELSYRQAIARGRNALNPKDDAGAYFMATIMWPLMLWFHARAFSRGR